MTIKNKSFNSTIQGEPEQKLLFAIWTQALKDINKGFLLDNGVIRIDDDEEQVEEIRSHAKEAYEWVNQCSGTFPLVAAALDKPVDIFREKTLRVIDDNKQKIMTRSTVTTQFIYATVSRFRNYEQAYQNNVKSGLYITVS